MFSRFCLLPGPFSGNRKRWEEIFGHLSGLNVQLAGHVNGLFRPFAVPDGTWRTVKYAL